ncbi:hypothetical protein [Acinetobacter baumannii]|uniref:hypothetical protein n=1 Tax=Acinetobacter baumannii TaxID=470 RepID=UPI002DBF5958|nr:hypothetical protein [Acinetobacter baumannii]MEB6558760.1 hypothetical protein [Acinetobacter baumannii]
MKLRTTLLSLITVSSISTIQAKPPTVQTFVKQYETEEQYQQAYIQAKKSFDYYNSGLYVNEPERLAQNRKDYCEWVDDRYALYDMTVLNNKFPSGYKDQMDLRASRQHGTTGVDRDVLRVMCYPKMKVLNEEDRWVDP